MSTRKFRRFSTCTGLALFLCAASGLKGQTTGTISGVVTDPTGATVPDARVTATLVQQNISRIAQSNAEGHYIFNALPPGEYRLAVEKAGFQRLVRTDLTLAVNQNLRVDLSMRLGEVSQMVEVSATAPLVDTRSPALSGLVDDQRVVDLPLNGRNVISLAATLPGILSVVAPQQLTDARSGPVMNVNGSVTTQNLFTFNGGIFVNPSRNTGMNYPPPDALQEFSIQTQNFTAEYGRNAGSQVNVVSKSGTNQIPRVALGVPAEQPPERPEFLRLASADEDPEPVRIRRRRADQERQDVSVSVPIRASRYRAEAVGVRFNVPSDARPRRATLRDLFQDAARTPSTR